MCKFSFLGELTLTQALKVTVILKQNRLEKKCSAFMVACKHFAKEILWRQCFCKQTFIGNTHTVHLRIKGNVFTFNLTSSFNYYYIKSLRHVYQFTTLPHFFLLPASIHYENTMCMYRPALLISEFLKHWCRYWVVFVCVVVIWVYIVVMCLQKWHYR